MAKLPQSVANIVAALFPKSQKQISEKLATEEFNQFSADAQEIQERLDSQAESNGTLSADLTDTKTKLGTAEARITELEGQLTTAQSAQTTAEQNATDLQTKLTASENEVTKLKQAVNPLAEEDASNQSSSDEVLTDTDIAARAAFSKN